METHIEDVLSQINAKKEEYNEIKNNDKTKLTLNDQLTIQAYEATMAEYNKLRRELALKKRTISEQKDALDINKVDAEKIANKIIAKLSDSNSLLGILLNKSINTFVAQYLHNNNQLAPDLSNKIKLLHYYISDGAPSKNVRLVDLQQFNDHEENEALLKQIAEEILLQDEYDNIMLQFLSVLKSDCNDIYKESKLADLTKTTLYLVDKQTQGKEFMRGPLTINGIKDLFEDLKKKDIQVGAIISTNINNRDMELEIIEQPSNGKILRKLLRRNHESIHQLFNKVLVYITEYIRERLQYKSYEICNNQGDNFYGVLLAELVQSEIAEKINYNQLEQWIKTNNKKSANWSRATTEANIDKLVDECIQEIYKIYSDDYKSIDNEYEIFVKFLQSNNVYNDNMNRQNYESDADYYDSLKKAYQKPLAIFKTELRSIIERRIALCKKELKIKDSEQYKILTTQEISDDFQNVLNDLNGYENKNGIHQLGYEEIVLQDKAKLTAKEDEIYNALLNKLQNQNINADLIKNVFYNQIIKALQNKSNIQAQIDELQRIMDILKDDGRNQKKYRQIVSIWKSLSKQDIDDYRKLYDLCKQNIQQRDKLRNLVKIYNSNNSTKQQKNSFLLELEDLYIKLYGENYSPLKVILQFQKQAIEMGNLPEDISEKDLKAKQDKFKDIKEKAKRIIEYLNIEKFIDYISTRNYSHCGLCGILVDCNKKIEKLKIPMTLTEEQERLSDEEKEKLINETDQMKKQVLANLQLQKQEILNRISIIQKRIKELNEISTELDISLDNNNASIFSELTTSKADLENQQDKMADSQAQLSAISTFIDFQNTIGINDYNKLDNSNSSNEKNKNKKSQNRNEQLQERKTQIDDLTSIERQSIKDDEYAASTEDEDSFKTKSNYTYNSYSNFDDPENPEDDSEEAKIDRYHNLMYNYWEYGRQTPQEWSESEAKKVQNITQAEAMKWLQDYIDDIKQIPFDYILSNEVWYYLGQYVDNLKTIKDETTKIQEAEEIINTTENENEKNQAKQKKLQAI